MKKNGITRKVDDLGRIVIPKEIRKNLKIRSYDELLIDVNNESIILSKYAKVENDDVLKALVLSVSNVLGINMLITSKDRVITSNDSRYNNVDLSNSIVKRIEKNESISSLNPIKFSLFNEINDYSYIISPLSILSTIVGSVIIFSTMTLDNNSIIVSNIIKKFLEKYLEES